jgi:transcriptional regulator with XRE-family HTH domain
MNRVREKKLYIQPLAAYVMDILDRHHMSVNQFSQKIGVSQASMSLFKNCLHEPNSSSMRKIAAGLSELEGKEISKDFLDSLISTDQRSDTEVSTASRSIDMNGDNSQSKPESRPSRFSELQVLIPLLVAEQFRHGMQNDFSRFASYLRLDESDLTEIMSGKRLPDAVELMKFSVRVQNSEGHYDEPDWWLAQMPNWWHTSVAEYQKLLAQTSL